MDFRQVFDVLELIIKRGAIAMVLMIMITFHFLSCKKTKPEDIFLSKYTPEQSRLMDSLQRVTANYYRSNADSAEILYDYMIHVIDSMHQDHQKFYILMDKVEFYQYRKPDFLKSYQNLIEAIALFIREPDAYISSAFSFIDIGNFFYRNNHPAQSITFYRMAISISKQSKNRLAEGVALQNIGLSFMKQNNLDSSVCYFNYAHQILADTIYITEAQNYLYLGKVSLMKNMPDSALYFVDKCRQMLDLFQAEKSMYNASSKNKFIVTYHDIACKTHVLLYQLNLKYQINDSSNFYFNQAQNLALESRSDNNLMDLYLIKLFDDPSAKKLTNAISCADSALHYARKLNDPFTYSAIADSVADYFRRLPNLNLSKKYHDYAAQLNDSLTKLIGSQSFMDSRILLSSVAAEQAIRVQNIEKKAVELKLFYHQVFIGIGVLIFIGLATVLSFIYVQNKKLHLAYANLSVRIRQSIKTDSPNTDRKLVFPETSQEIIANLENLMTTEKCHIDKKLTLQEMAKRLNTNKSYLSSILNNTYEMNFNDYINHLRVKEACIILMKRESAKLSLDQIAELSGFNSRSAFYKAFKKFTGMSPAAFIKTIPPSMDMELKPV